MAAIDAKRIVTGSNAPVPQRSTNVRSGAARLVARARQSPFVANLAVLSGASAIGALIGLIATPIVSRLYLPAEFGVLGVFAASLAMASVLATLRYDLAIPGAPDDREAASILLVALCTVIATSTLCAVLVATGAVGMLMSATRDHTTILVWTLPLGMAATGTYTALSSWMVRRRAYRTLGQTRITQGGSMAGTQVGLGFLHAGAIGLIIGQIAGSSAGIARMSRQLLGNDRSIFSNLPPSHLTKTARTYRRFPLLSGPAVLLDALTGALPVLVVASRFGTEAAGVFAIVQRVLVAPLSLITTNLGQVIFGDLAQVRRTDPVAMMDVFYRRLRQVLLMGVILIGAAAIVVPFTLPTILGPHWEKATSFFLILSPMLLANFIAVPFGFAIDVLRRQDLHILRDGLRASVLIGALKIASVSNFDVSRTLVMITFAGCINSVIYLGISWMAVRHAVRNLETVSGSEAVMGSTSAGESLEP